MKIIFPDDIVILWSALCGKLGTRLASTIDDKTLMKAVVEWLHILEVKLNRMGGLATMRLIIWLHIETKMKP